MYLPIDIRLTVNDVTNLLREKKPQHILFSHKIIRDVNNIKHNLPRSLTILYGYLDIIDIHNLLELL